MHTDCVGIDRRKADRVDLDDMKSEWEMKTITSAIKNYFRCVCLSVMTVVNVHVHSIGLFRFFFSRLSCLQIHSVSVVLNLQIATWATDDIQTSSEVHKCCKCVFFSYLLCSCTFTVNFLLCELCLHFTGLLNQSFDTNEFHFPCYDALMRPSYSRCIALCLSVHPSIFSRHVTHKWWSWWCVFAQSKSLERCELMTSMNLYISCRSQTLRCSMFS